MKRTDRDRIQSAIDAAEAGTTGRIAVRILPQETADALESAREHLHQAELHHHPHRNAVIFLVAPKSRRFAVYGDQAIHDIVGDDFWTDVVAEMRPHFMRGDVAGAIVHGVNRAGAELRRHFPRGAAT